VGIRDGDRPSPGIVVGRAVASCLQYAPAMTWQRWTLIALVVGGCGSQAPTEPDAAAPPEVDAAPEGPAWLPTSWPSDVPDPVAAGARVIELMSGRWRLDLSSTPPDTACDALDCPGPADGYDPTLAAAGDGDWDVTTYAVAVHPPTRLWRELDASKHVVLVNDSLAIGMGEVTEFYRRALDGSLLIVRGNTTEGLDGPDDFWKAGFADLGDRIQVTTTDPLGNVGGIKIQISTQPDSIVVAGEIFSFRAPRDLEPEVDQSIPPELTELTGDPAPARAVELVHLALANQEASRGVVAEILHLLSRAEPEVRLAAAQYALVSYDWWWNKVSRVIQADQLIARLLQDPDLAVRTAIANGIRTMWTTVPDRFYHCSIDWAVHRCAADDADASVAAACQEVVDLGRTPYGYCPWL